MKVSYRVVYDDGQVVEGTTKPVDVVTWEQMAAGNTRKNPGHTGVYQIVHVCLQRLAEKCGCSDHDLCRWARLPFKGWLGELDAIDVDAYQPDPTQRPAEPSPAG